MQRRVGTALLLLAAAAAGCASAPPRPARPADVAIDSALALVTFDSAWSRIASTHYSADYGGVDWPAVRSELRPRAAEARSLGALRAVIGEMLQRLGESHYALLPRESVDGEYARRADAAAAVPGTAGLDVRIVDDEFVVWRVDPDGAAAARRILPGWTLVAIDGRPLAPRLLALQWLPDAERRPVRTRLLYAVNGELRGEAGARVALRLRDGSGRSVDRSVELRPARGEVITYGGLPPAVADLAHARLDAGDDCVGTIRFTLWAVPLLPAFDDAIDALRDCAGIIVDVRGNPGGVAGMVMGTAGHFLADTLALGYLRTRSSELRYMANPRRVRRDGTLVEPFAGRVALLVDEMSASTSEIFAAALQATGRARVFGSTTAGQALPALMVRLPTGDVLMHAIADFTAPDGTRIEGRGVIPDAPVELTRRDLLRRRDAPFEAAVHWITHGGTAP